MGRELRQSEHSGYANLLYEMTGALPAPARVSEEALGSVLRELATTAPEGSLRSELEGRITASDGSVYKTATLAKALAALEKGQLVTRRASYAGPAGGRPPVRYALGSPQRAMVGVHVTVDRGRPVCLTVSLHGLGGELLKTDVHDIGQDVLDWTGVAMEIAVFAREMIKTWMDEGESDEDRAVLGLGVEVPGHVHRGRVLQADHAGYELPERYSGYSGQSAPLASEISKQLDGLTVVLDNDVNLIALREMYRPGSHWRPRDGGVIAVFNQGVGAGMIANGAVYRGYRGAAGEPGHTCVFNQAGQPRSAAAVRQSRGRTDGQPQPPVPALLGFDDQCSCGASGHVDCYATPDRITVELGKDPDDFPSLAGMPAYDSGGSLTPEGDVFWKAGAALGLGVVGVLHNFNPGWLLLLLPPALATASPGDGTAAGLYRQAVETMLDEHAFSTTASDARRGADRLEVRALAEDSEEGRRKAARNAAIRVLDEFVAHALKRDDCVQELQENAARPLNSTTPMDLRRREREARKEMRAILKRHDPEGLLALPDTAADEYSMEEADLLRLVVKRQVDADNLREVWTHRFGQDASLLADEERFYDLLRDLRAAQNRWHR